MPKPARQSNRLTEAHFSGVAVRKRPVPKPGYGRFKGEDGNQTSLFGVVRSRMTQGRNKMVKAGILWLLGVPLFVIILLALFTNIF